MEEVVAEFMLMADGAQAVGGKLYVLGGAWTHLWISEFPGRPSPPVAVAVGLRIPYNQTNRRFRLALEVVDADGNRIDEPATGEIEVGRPPGLRPGASQRFVMTALVNSEFPEAGRYLVRALIDEEEKSSTWFEVAKTEV